MTNEIATLDGNLPAYLQGVGTSVTDDLMHGVGGDGGNRISLKGSRFRLIVNGVEESVIEQSSLDVIILGASPGVSRIYYKDVYSPESSDPPMCYSKTGDTPAPDVKQPQSPTCSQCPHNVKGSKVVNGVSSKECSSFRRLVVMLVGDESGTVLKLEVKGMGLFGGRSGNGRSVNLNEYAKMLSSRGLNANTVVTRVSFDSNSSVPKLLFRPARYVSEQELQTASDLISSPEVQALREVSMNTMGEDSPQAAAPQKPKQRPVADPFGDDDEEEVAPPTPLKPRAGVAKPKPAPVADDEDEDEDEEEVAPPTPPKPRAGVAKPRAGVATPKPAVEEADEVLDAESESELEDILNGLD